MQKLLQKQAPQLRVAHQNEVLQLRRALAELRSEMIELKKIINVTTIDKADRKIVLHSNGRHHFILLSDIIYCEADGNYTKVFIKQTNQSPSKCSILISKTLKSVVDLFDSSDFIRCHQSYLINKKHVIGYELIDGLQLKLTCSKMIPVSRRKKKLVLDSI